MADQPMFRAAALGTDKTKWLGDIVLIRPLSYRILTTMAVGIATIIVTFMVWGTYTKRNTVLGQLVPDTGLVKVYATQTGIVQEKRVAEGQQVRRGDILYVLSSERQSGTQGSVQAAISQQVESRRHSLRNERDKTRHLQRDERETLVRRIESIAAELHKLDGLVAGQGDRFKLSEESVARYKDLLAKDYISREQLQQKQEEMLDQNSRLQGLERERISVARELAARRRELAGLALKHENQLSQIERGISSIDQELTESEGKRQLNVAAPQAGTVTTLLAELGQAVDGSRPLVSIVPEGARLQVHLHAPSRAVGFVRPGDAVLLRYQAYPYQKFGHAQGKVRAVAKTALPANEVSGLANAADDGRSSEPLYRITVELNEQTLKAYGKEHALQAGMLLEADILQDTRRLYEWVLEPLFSLTGKL